METKKAKKDDLIDEKELEAFCRAEDNFSKKYVFVGCVGTIEDGDGTPVTLSSLSVCLSGEERGSSLGRRPNEAVIFVKWVPAGLQYSSWQEDGGFPEEIGVDQSKIPPPETWVVFPRTFEGYNVYYKRGSMAFAL